MNTTPKEKTMTSMTSEQAWEFIKTCKSSTWVELRRVAVLRLTEYSNGYDGISSSDINHEVVAILTHASYDSSITARMVAADPQVGR